MAALPAEASAPADAELPVDPVESALEAGLRYVSDAERGIRRRRRGRGFSYQTTAGVRFAPRPNSSASVRSPFLRRGPTCGSASTPLGHLQATGRDAKGRKQYRYHPRWREVRDANKFTLLGAFGHSLPDLRDRIDAELRQTGLPRAKVLAVVVRLLDDTLVRVGNREYADDNETYGLTTITPDHVDVGWRNTTFDFVGKGGIDHHVTVEDARIARIIRRCHELGGQALFSYQRRTVRESRRSRRPTSTNTCARSRVPP